MIFRLRGTPVGGTLTVEEEMRNPEPPNMRKQERHNTASLIFDIILFILVFSFFVTSWVHFFEQFD